jgi:DNA (cytosine-5)-methyltransferase 1
MRLRCRQPTPDFTYNGSVAKSKIVGVDLFCGAGGLTYGLQRAGIEVVAGFDVDPACEYPYSTNCGSRFVLGDIKDVTGAQLKDLYPLGSIRLLAGCAPCQPFSPHRRKAGKTSEKDWALLNEFSRLVYEVTPELVTMENVPGLATKPVFLEFIMALKSHGYAVDFRSLYCPRFGIPQHRRRMVLVASRIGQIRVPVARRSRGEFPTVRTAIGGLPEVEAGTAHPKDPLHMARAFTEINLRRLQASQPGGTWKDWPEELRSACHLKPTGLTYQSVYARMVWDEPAPTITTQAYNFGTGRFGHPEQDRALTLREAAILQSFPRHYEFVKPGNPVYLTSVGRLIGNAVPPLLAYFIGIELTRTARKIQSSLPVSEPGEDKGEKAETKDQ